MTPIAEVGYTFGYNYKYDWFGYYIAKHNDYYDEYEIDKRSGGYLKIGGFFNLRRDFENRISFISDYF